MLNNRQRSIFTRGFAIIAVLCGLCVVNAQVPSAEAKGEAEAGGVAGVASRSVIRMQEMVKKADTLATRGGELQSNGMNKEAMEAYKQAFEITPRVPATEQRRIAYFKRYQNAAAAYAQTLADQAEFKKAQNVLTTVYRSAQQSGDIPPSAISTNVSSLLKKLKNEHFNPALSPAHLKRVSRVKQLLHEARGATDLGDFDKAAKRYNQVLSIDPYNVASRRGLEIVEQYKIKYHGASRNHTRSKLLSNLASKWELPVPLDLSTGNGIAHSDAQIGSNRASIEAKLKGLEVPSIEFQDARLSDVLEFLTQKSQELDITEKDPAKRGVNFIINAAKDAPERPLSIKLSNIPIGAALTYIGQKVGLKYRVDEFAVIMIPINSTADEAMINRNFTVPPDFLSGGGGGAADNADAADDPFAEPAAGSPAGTPIDRLSAKAFLEQSGVAFDAGATANYNPRTSVLTVRNRPDQLELIEILVASSKESVPKIIQIDFKMISISTTGLKQLGFDWLLGQANVPGSNDVFSSGGTLSNAATSRSAGDFPFLDPITGTPVGTNPLTAGLRMSNSRGTLSIDDVLNGAAPGAPGGNPGPSPALFGLSGVFTDPQFQTVIRGLNQSKSTDRLNSSSVVVRPGERASIRQVREFIYPTEYDPPEISNGAGILPAPAPGILPPRTALGNAPVTPATPTAFETRELGIVVEVEPVVGEDNQTVSLNIITDINDFAGFINYGTPITQVVPVGFPPVPTLAVFTQNRILMPVFNAVKETTNVTVWDSQTIAIGGMVIDEVDDIEDKIPVLGDLPVIGRTFRSTVKESTKRGVIMFVSVRILDPSGQPINQKVGKNTLPEQAGL